jgi:hypothetical protein
MIYLLFTARLQEPKGWRFWKRELADVYALIPVGTVNDAKIQAQSDMKKRGYSIEKIHIKKDVSEWDGIKLAYTVRMDIWMAKKTGPFYQFHEHSGLWPIKSEIKSLEVRSRLLDDPDIRIVASIVPKELRSLISFGKEWAIMDDVERSQFIRTVPIKKKKAFVGAVIPKLDAIAEYSKKHESDSPMPNEVVLLNLLAEAADEASFDVQDDQE